jgi:aminopeptidase N
MQKSSLANPLQKGDTLALVTSYSGKDVVFNEGNANYYPVARNNWYPSTRIGDYADYDLTLRVPKGLTTLATGKPQGQTLEENTSVTKWKSEVPLPVAGFALGGFREKSAKLQNADLVVSAYANVTQDQYHSDLDVIVPVAGIQQVLEEGKAASEIYVNLFGLVSFGHVALTEQLAPNFGQSWPELIFLPRTSFLTKQLGFGAGKVGRWLESVIPHEVAHQWWGQSVGFSSYRDQWMSEGFSEFSASLYVQIVWGQDDYLQFWKDRLAQLTERNSTGFRSIDVGPLVMGNRLVTAKTGYGTYSNLIYPKGAFVLHMLRMMMWTPQQKDIGFSAMMEDFLNTYRGKSATAEDFQRIVEKHMTPSMDLTHNGKMDWFFEPWVQGTELPQYAFSYKLEKTPEGRVALNWSLRQSNVSANFQMPVPIYLELNNKQFAKLGLIAMKGNSSREGKTLLGNLDSMPKRALINYQYDVLCFMHE